MAKTLCIKNADFSTNKVTAVSFGGSVPCTAITFSQNSYSLTDYTPVSIIYTLTPSNTTDSVTWASSDTDVVTVDGGVITAVGLGTATITATCGTQTATATVTVAIECNPAFAFAYIAAAGNNTFTANSENATRIAAYGKGTEAGQYICPASSSGTNMPVIKIPKGTESITFSFADTQRLKYSDDEIDWWLKDESVGVAYPTAAKLILKGSWYNGFTTPSKTINVPEGADSFLYSFMVSAVESGETAADVAEAVGLTITFNTGTV